MEASTLSSNLSPSASVETTTAESVSVNPASSDTDNSTDYYPDDPHYDPELDLLIKELANVSKCENRDESNSSSTITGPYWDLHPTKPVGLYDPKHESDACGVGAIADFQRRATRSIMDEASEMLIRMTHRGATTRPGDGDGAGILCSIPDRFFREELEREGVDLSGGGGGGFQQESSLHSNQYNLNENLGLNQGLNSNSNTSNRQGQQIQRGRSGHRQMNGSNNPQNHNSSSNNQYQYDQNSTNNNLNRERSISAQSSDSNNTTTFNNQNQNNLNQIQPHPTSTLPPPGDYGVGIVFLPRLDEKRSDCKILISKIARKLGLVVLGWRQVPTDSRHLGPYAAATEPYMAQIFVALAKTGTQNQGHNTNHQTNLNSMNGTNNGPGLKRRESSYGNNMNTLGSLKRGNSADVDSNNGNYGNSNLISSVTSYNYEDRNMMTFTGSLCSVDHTPSNLLNIQMDAQKLGKKSSKPGLESMGNGFGQQDSSELMNQNNTNSAEPIPETTDTTTAETKARQTLLSLKLFLLRRLCSIRGKELYFCSLSNHVVVYKGQLCPSQLFSYFLDLSHPLFSAHLAVVHSRFSTNSFPSWSRAHPHRVLAHNGEINTFQGNRNNIKTREAKMEQLSSSILKSINFSPRHLFPIDEAVGSDSAFLDNVIELLAHCSSRDMAETMMLLVPEAWENDKTLDIVQKANKQNISEEDSGNKDIDKSSDDPNLMNMNGKNTTNTKNEELARRKAFLQYQSCLSEAWDGPALLVFSDGLQLGATLDRNGLRPGRYYITRDRSSSDANDSNSPSDQQNLRLILASEVGVVDVDPRDVIKKGRLQPGKMLLLDFEEGRIIEDGELKRRAANKHDYVGWSRRNLMWVKDLLRNTNGSNSVGPFNLALINDATTSSNTLIELSDTRLVEQLLTTDLLNNESMTSNISNQINQVSEFNGPNQYGINAGLNKVTSSNVSTPVAPDTQDQLSSALFSAWHLRYQVPLLALNGYTCEKVELLLTPMCLKSSEPLGSMGSDTPLACLSRIPRAPFDYFYQLFAQATNPAIDPLREGCVMSLECPIGPEGNILEAGPGQYFGQQQQQQQQYDTQSCPDRIFLDEPILDVERFKLLQRLPHFYNATCTLDLSYSSETAGAGLSHSAGSSGMTSNFGSISHGNPLETRLDQLCSEAEAAIRLDGAKLLILTHRRLLCALYEAVSTSVSSGGSGSDFGLSQNAAYHPNYHHIAAQQEESTPLPVSSQLAVGCLHQYLVEKKLRSEVTIVVEAADAFEIHHHCCLLGYGCDAIYPFMCYLSLRRAREIPAASEETKSSATSTKKTQTASGDSAKNSTTTKKESTITKTTSLARRIQNYRVACHQGLMKVMSKCGISTLQSYKGAQLFQIVGISPVVIAKCFAGTDHAKLNGVGFDVFHVDAVRLHALGVQQIKTPPLVDDQTRELPDYGEYHFRSIAEYGGGGSSGGGFSEFHLNSPDVIAKLQEAAKRNSRDAYRTFEFYQDKITEQTEIRGQLELCYLDGDLNDITGTQTVNGQKVQCPLDLSEVEPASEIVKRFVTGAVSLGAISEEAHKALALSMNRVGGKSNTGEGGEESARFLRRIGGPQTQAQQDQNHNNKSNNGIGQGHSATLKNSSKKNKNTSGAAVTNISGTISHHNHNHGYVRAGAVDWLVDSQNDSFRSKIKQVASGRFGVTAEYLVDADEIQIKLSQGAKPGEGGELPGYKVVGKIADVRRATPGVTLISPPPHHDMYSIEDVAQLISDLKHINPKAVISVKLVSRIGVGIIASGIVKGKATHLTISGGSGGTGAAKWTSIKRTGLPWELGIAETHQTLTQNGLRGLTVLQADGQMRSSRDVVTAFLLGADEIAMTTMPLITLGCIMMRKCHANTCPVGVATQDPELRAKFSGQPEHLINYLFLMAEEVRVHMARLGISKVVDLIGRSDLLRPPKKNLLGNSRESVRCNRKTATLDYEQLLKPAWTFESLLGPTAAAAVNSSVSHNVSHLNQSMTISHVSGSSPILAPVQDGISGQYGTMSTLNIDHINRPLPDNPNDNRDLLRPGGTAVTAGATQFGGSVNLGSGVGSSNFMSQSVVIQSPSHANAMNSANFSSIGISNPTAMGGSMVSSSSQPTRRPFSSNISNIRCCAGSSVADSLDHFLISKCKTLAGLGPLDELPDQPPLLLEHGGQTGSLLDSTNLDFTAVFNSFQNHESGLSGTIQHHHDQNNIGIDPAASGIDLASIAEEDLDLENNLPQSQSVQSLQDSGQTMSLENSLDLSSNTLNHVNLSLNHVQAVSSSTGILNPNTGSFTNLMDAGSSSSKSGSPASDSQISLLPNSATGTRGLGTQNVKGTGNPRVNNNSNQMHIVQNVNVIPEFLPTTIRNVRVGNTHRSVGALLSYAIVRWLRFTRNAGYSQYNQMNYENSSSSEQGQAIHNHSDPNTIQHSIVAGKNVQTAPDDRPLIRELVDNTIRVFFHGSAGQSFGAFLVKGVSFELEGDANDGFGKGLAGGTLSVYPPGNDTLIPHENIIIGNAALYGSTGGYAFICGVASERFAIRNSGAVVVVEGAGDHCLEYMTRGLALILGKIGRNFAAGMSGGVAFVLDLNDDDIPILINNETVTVEPINNAKSEDVKTIKNLIEEHYERTKGRSLIAKQLLEEGRQPPFSIESGGSGLNFRRFHRIFPKEYRKVLKEAILQHTRTGSVIAGRILADYEALCRNPLPERRLFGGADEFLLTSSAYLAGGGSRKFESVKRPKITRNIGLPIGGTLREVGGVGVVSTALSGHGSNYPLNAGLSSQLAPFFSDIVGGSGLGQNKLANFQNKKGPGSILDSNSRSPSRGLGNMNHAQGPNKTNSNLNIHDITESQPLIKDSEIQEGSGTGNTLQQGSNFSGSIMAELGVGIGINQSHIGEEDVITMFRRNYLMWRKDYKFKKKTTKTGASVKLTPNSSSAASINKQIQGKTSLNRHNTIDTGDLDATIDNIPKVNSTPECFESKVLSEQSPALSLTNVDTSNNITQEVAVDNANESDDQSHQLKMLSTDLKQVFSQQSWIKAQKNLKKLLQGVPISELIATGAINGKKKQKQIGSTQTSPQLSNNNLSNECGCSTSASSASGTPRGGGCTTTTNIENDSVISNSDASSTQGTPKSNQNQNPNEKSQNTQSSTTNYDSPYLSSQSKQNQSSVNDSSGANRPSPQTPGNEKKQYLEVISDVEDILGPSLNGITQLNKPTAVSIPQKKQGFHLYGRKTLGYRDPKARVLDSQEIYATTNTMYSNRYNTLIKTQASRCMDCGTPTCSFPNQMGGGCPLSNKIPQWNQLVYESDWKRALESLLSTNSFPEFTGTTCPAPCEESCVLGINKSVGDEPVTIKSIELAIIEKGFQMGWVQNASKPPLYRTKKRVIVVGSGPAGLAAAQQLNRVGHSVTVVEREDYFGGLLFYGIPSMKLDKARVVRRITLMKKEGIKFLSQINVGGWGENGEGCTPGYDVLSLTRNYDAVLFCTGANAARRIASNVINSNKNYTGVIQAMDFLTHSQKIEFTENGLLQSEISSVSGPNGIVTSMTNSDNANNSNTQSHLNQLQHGTIGTILGNGVQIHDPEAYNACEKNVIVLGGGDTAVDVIGTAIRQGAKSVTQFSRRGKARDDGLRPEHTPWPAWADVYRVDYAHSEYRAVYGSGGSAHDNSDINTTVNSTTGTSNVRNNSNTGSSGPMIKNDPREFCIRAHEFVPAIDSNGQNTDRIGKVIALQDVQIQNGSTIQKKVTFDADIVVLAMGFVGAEKIPLGIAGAGLGQTLASNELFHDAKKDSSVTDSNTISKDANAVVTSATSTNLSTDTNQSTAKQNATQSQQAQTTSITNNSSSQKLSLQTRSVQKKPTPLDLYHLGHNIFFAGDCRRGASLVVTAIAEGRDVANRIDAYLQSKDSLFAHYGHHAHSAHDTGRAMSSAMASALPRCTPLAQNPALYYSPDVWSWESPFPKAQMAGGGFNRQYNNINKSNTTMISNQYGNNNTSNSTMLKQSMTTLSNTKGTGNATRNSNQNTRTRSRRGMTMSNKTNSTNQPLMLALGRSVMTQNIVQAPKEHEISAAFERGFLAEDSYDKPTDNVNINSLNTSDLSLSANNNIGKNFQDDIGFQNQNNDSNVINLSVSETGIGGSSISISPVKLDNIVNPVSRSETSDYNLTHGSHNKRIKAKLAVERHKALNIVGGSEDTKKHRDSELEVKKSKKKLISPRSPNTSSNNLIATRRHNDKQNKVTSSSSKKRKTRRHHHNRLTNSNTDSNSEDSRSSLGATSNQTNADSDLSDIEDDSENSDSDNKIRSRKGRVGKKIHSGKATSPTRLNNRKKSETKKKESLISTETLLLATLGLTLLSNMGLFWLLSRRK